MQPHRAHGQQRARDPLSCVPPQHKRPEKGQRQPSPERSTAPSEGDEFSSFLFWRAPLPSIEEELQELLVRPAASPLAALLSDRSVARARAGSPLAPRKIKPPPLARRPQRSTRALRRGPALRKRRMRRRATTRAGSHPATSSRSSRSRGTVTRLLSVSRSAASPRTSPCRWVLAAALHGAGSRLGSAGRVWGADPQIAETSGLVKSAPRDGGAQERPGQREAGSSPQLLVA